MGNPVADYRIKETKRQYAREIAEVAYYYSQYTLEEAAELPVGDRRLLLNFARLHQAESSLDFLTLLAASGSKTGFKKKSDDLRETIKEITKQLI
jgi:hypothetical protein